jgi:hypothetical protein
MRELGLLHRTYREAAARMVRGFYPSIRTVSDLGTQKRRKWGIAYDFFMPIKFIIGGAVILISLTFLMVTSRKRRQS